ASRPRRLQAGRRRRTCAAGHGGRCRYQPMSAHAVSQRVVIAGGGVAALEATLALRALAQERVSIELVAPEPDFVYRPLAVTDPFRVGETRRFPLAPLVEAAGASLSRGHVAAVDPDRRRVATEEGPEHSY